MELNVYLDDANHFTVNRNDQRRVWREKIIFNVTCVLCVIVHRDAHALPLYNMKETVISQWLQVSSAEPSVSVILMLHMMPVCVKTHGLCGELRSNWLLWQLTDTVVLLTVSDPWDSDMNLTCFRLARVSLMRVDILYFPFQEFLIIDCEVVESICFKIT